MIIGDGTSDAIGNHDDLRPIIIAVAVTVRGHGWKDEGFIWSGVGGVIVMIGKAKMEMKREKRKRKEKKGRKRNRNRNG